MNRITLFFVFLLAIGCAVSKAQPRDKKTAANRSGESEVQKASDIYYRAFYSGDVDMVKRMTRDDYLQTDVLGNVQDKAQWLTGGSFGPEASIFAVVVDTAMVLLFWRWRRNTKARLVVPGHATPDHWSTPVAAAAAADSR